MAQLGQVLKRGNHFAFPDQFEYSILLNFNGILFFNFEQQAFVGNYCNTKIAQGQQQPFPGCLRFFHRPMRFSNTTLHPKAIQSKDESRVNARCRAMFRDIFRENGRKNIPEASSIPKTEPTPKISR